MKIIQIDIFSHIISFLQHGDVFALNMSSVGLNRILLKLNINISKPCLDQVVRSVQYLNWTKDLNCPWNEMLCSAAARQGNLTILQYLRRKGCPWDSWTCVEASTYNRNDILLWARDHGCPWDKWTFC